METDPNESDEEPSEIEILPKYPWEADSNWVTGLEGWSKEQLEAVLVAAGESRLEEAQAEDLKRMEEANRALLWRGQIGIRNFRS